MSFKNRCPNTRLSSIMLWSKIRIIQYTSLIAFWGVMLALPAYAKSNNGERVVATHGEWQVICAKPLGAKSEKCGAVTKVKAADIPDVGLVITFMKAGRNDKILLRVRAPLGVLLLNGLGLKIDDVNVGSVDFIRCTVSGCIAHVFIDDTLEKKFRKGNMAMFIIFKTPEQGIAIPISLSGLSQAYAAMK